jgi:hypothetical protein
MLPRLIERGLDDQVIGPIDPFTEPFPKLAQLLPSLCSEPPIVEFRVAQTARLQGDEWQRAQLAWLRGDREAFAVLIGSELVIPSEVRSWLKQLFGPKSRYSNTLVLKSSKALASHLKRFVNKIDIGMSVLKLIDEGVGLKKARGEIQKKYGKSASYIDHCMKLGRAHYKRLLEGIAQSDAEVASRGRIWRKLTAEERKAQTAVPKRRIARINNVDVPIEFY